MIIEMCGMSDNDRSGLVAGCAISREPHARNRWRSVGSSGHAYAAARDAPVHLRCFVAAVRPTDDLESAVDWLWGSILHQGSLYSASPPVIWVLVDLPSLFYSP